MAGRRTVPNQSYPELGMRYFIHRGKKRRDGAKRVYGRVGNRAAPRCRNR